MISELFATRVASRAHTARARFGPGGSDREAETHSRTVCLSFTHDQGTFIHPRALPSVPAPSLLSLPHMDLILQSSLSFDSSDDEWSPEKNTNATTDMANDNLERCFCGQPADEDSIYW